MLDVNKVRDDLLSESPQIRNAAAMKIMDAGDVDLLHFLVEAIERPENRNARGTLIYALSAFDCTNRFCELFRWACEGGFEATGEALSIIYDQEFCLSTSEINTCKRLLSELKLTASTHEHFVIANELHKILLRFVEL